jgi:benzoylformate decarboxylase
VTGADWLLAALAGEGVELLFGNPGSTELPLTDALGRQSGVRYVLGLTEPAVIGMADGYAQQSGRLAAVNVHVQPGLANALSGILNAARARVPLLVTVGQQVSAMLPGDPFLGGELVELARPIAKGAWEARTPDELGELTTLAVRTALTHPRGPVVLGIPVDVQTDTAPSPHSRAHIPSPPAPPEAALDLAAALLDTATSPVLLVGDGVHHAGAGGLAATLAERLGAPIYSEPLAAHAPLPTDHPLWRGLLPPFAVDIRRTLQDNDMVIALGMPVFRLFGPSQGSPLPAGVRLVHADVDPHEVGKVHPPQVGLVGDVGAALEGLLARLGAAPPASQERCERESGRTAALRHTTRQRHAREAAAPGIAPAALCRQVAAFVGPRDLVVDEALTAGRNLRASLGRRMPGTWLAHRGSALGWGLPAAVGAKLADPGRRVLCVHGDGSLLFGVHALWTAAHEGLGLGLVVADNGGYEILRAGLEGLTGRAEGAWPGLALDGPAIDHVAIARGFGATAERVEHPGDLRTALCDLWRRAADGPAVLVVPVEGRTPPVGYPPEAW